MRLAILLPLFIQAGITLSQAYVGDWTSYTSIHYIKDLAGSRGDLFVATPGGIRKVPPKGSEKVYRNTEGLLDVGISALVTSSVGDVYATSELGYLYQYNRNQDEWDILAASYRSSGWRMNKRALIYRDGYLILGSDKGLSFFDINKKIAAVNVTKMGSVSALSVNSVLFVSDTLFVGTNHGIFKATLHLEKLMTDANINIFNPAIWTLVPGTGGVLFFDPNPRSNDSNYVKDSLKIVNSIVESKKIEIREPSFDSHGSLYHDDHGIGSEYEGSWLKEQNASASYYGTIIIDGKGIGGNFRMETLCYLNGRWFCGSKYSLFEFFPSTGGFTEIKNAEDIPNGNVIAVRANRFGVSIFSDSYIYQLKDRVWKSLDAFPITNDATDSKRSGQHAFNVMGESNFYVGTWGFGFQAFQNGVRKVFDAENSCLSSAELTARNYPVIWSQTPYRDKGIWMGVSRVARPYQIGYFDFSTETISCFEPKASLIQPKSISTVRDSVIVVVGEQGAEAFAIIDHGGTVGLELNNLLNGLAGTKERTLAGKADNVGNYWVTTEGSGLLYIPAIQFKVGAIQSYKSLEDFSGIGCNSLEIDPQGHLWAACNSGGVFEIIPGRDSLSSSFRKYGLKDGLLSENIYHLDVNKENGEVWIVTEKGLSRLESTSRPAQANLSSLKVYPNPFLKKHSTLIFSNLAPKSEVQVLTQSGSVVYRKTLLPGVGDQIRWNGNNQSGQRVREGVYFYSVKSPKEAKNGKIIVAR